MNQEVSQRRQVIWAGVGLVFGAALGLLISLLFTVDLVMSMVAGAALGLIFGSVVELLLYGNVDEGRHPA